MFTCGGRRVALIEAFRHAMKQLDITGKVLVTDITPASATFHTADEAMLVPTADDEDYIPTLIKICDNHNIGLVIPLTDLDLRIIATHRNDFEKIRSKVMIGAPETILTCQDKIRTSKFLKKIGLKPIRTFTLSQFRERPFFPCFIKPLRGSASMGTGVLNCESELNAHLAAYGESMLVQDYIPGAEYTLDIYRNKAGEVLCVVPRQRLSIRAGEVEKGLTVNDAELIEAGVRIGENLEGVWGVVNAQCRRPPGGKPHFFEINPRFGGGVPLAIAAGANLPRYVLEETLGLPVSAELGSFKSNLLMLRYDSAIFVHVDNPETLPGYSTQMSR